MLVICCGMARAGSTVQYHLTCEIVEQAGRGSRLGYFRPAKLASFLREYAPSPEITVIKAHDYVDAVAELADQKRITAVYAYRDIRDIVVSKRNQENRSFWGLAHQLPESQIAQYERWTALPGAESREA